METKQSNFDDCKNVIAILGGEYAPFPDITLKYGETPIPVIDEVLKDRIVSAVYDYYLDKRTENLSKQTL